MNDKEKILDKIRKCLALASSSNEHEAAAALRQAQKLMELHCISDAELLAAGVSEASAHAGASRKPVAWETRLTCAIGDAFGCRVIFSPGYGSGNWLFIGVGAAAEVAQYAFTVLFRQLRRNRAAFIKEKCKRLIPKNKTRRADLYCEAWVRAVAIKAEAMAGQEQATEAINAYLTQAHPELRDMQPRDRNENRTLRDKDVDAYAAGAADGRNAQLSHGVGNSDAPNLIGMAA